MQPSLRKSLTLSALALTALVGTHAHAEQHSQGDAGDALRWQTVTGILQPNGVVGAGTGAVTGGGAPWSALDGRASVKLATGRLEFDVRGLVLAAGNAIGTPGPVLQVKGTLVCDTDGSASGGNSVLVDTPLVELGDQGDARLRVELGPLPSACAVEPDVAFLVRTASGRWIASGMVLR